MFDSIVIIYTYLYAYAWVHLIAQKSHFISIGMTSLLLFSRVTLIDFLKKNFSTFMEKSKPFPDELIRLCGSYIIDNGTGITGTLQMDAEVT